MTDHLIAPPPELVEQWLEQSLTSRELAAKAFQAGADQELEACVNYVDNTISGNKARALRAHRRPKPPSLKELALAALAAADGADHPVVCTVITADQHAIVRRALEQLDD